MPWVFAVVPMVGLAIWLCFRRSAGHVAAGPRRAQKLQVGPRRIESKRSPGHSLRGAALALGAFCVIASLARPQWGEQQEAVFESGREVVLALDLSRSMNATDVVPSRLARSKLLIQSLLDELAGERVGLVVFAGTSFLQVPLSADYEVLRELLPGLTPDHLPQGGTDYAAMLETASRAFHDADGQGDRFLIVLSDGEAHDSRWREQLPHLVERGIRVVGLGVGTDAGDVVPDGTGGLVKDERGGVVLSRLAPETLRQLALETDGRYRDAAAWVDIAALMEETVLTGALGDTLKGVDLRRQDRFQWLLLPGVLLLFVAFWLELPAHPSRRRIEGRRDEGLGSGAVAAGGLLLALGMAFVPPATAVEADAASGLAPLIQRLSRSATLGAEEYGQLAEATVDFATEDPSLPASVRHAVVGDGLEAVRRGAALDPGARDWAALAQQLEAQRAPPAARKTPDREQNGSQSGSQSQSESGSDSGDAGEEASGSSDAGENAAAEGSESQQASESGDPGAAGASSGTGAGALSQGAPDDAGETATGESADAGASADPSDREEALGEGGTPAEPRPLEREAAGIGALGEGDSPEERAAKSEAKAAEVPPQEQRVGGGTGISEFRKGNPQLAGALRLMEAVRKADAPGVLFQRMQALEAGSQAPLLQTGKDW